MSFRKYEEYKDSGVEWLGEIPEHWAAAKAQTCVSSFSSYRWDNLQKSKQTLRKDIEELVSDTRRYLKTKSWIKKCPC